MTTPHRQRSSVLLALVAVAGLLLAGCGSDGGDDESTGDSSTTEATTASTTEAEPSTEPSTSETTVSTPDDGETTTTAGDDGSGLSPGDPCSLEEGVPDCIDPDGDGEGVYLTGGADCAATAPDIVICEDLDGDGVAGYPDEYEGLPPCRDEVPPPCNNEPGSAEE